MVRKEILGASERRILIAYLNGERLKDYTVLLHRIRKIGLKAIILGCERDLRLLRKLARKEKVSLHEWHRFFSDDEIASSKQ
jgi:hypothetical protein